MNSAHVEMYSCTFAPCLVLYQIRSFIVVMKMQFAKFSFEFDPTQIIKCLPACHSAILYILHLQLSTLLMNQCVWRLLFGFHSEVVTLTAWGKFCNHQFILVQCFALNAVGKCSLNITHIILGCIISLLISWGALYCIKFTCLGYGTLHSFPRRLFP